MKLNIEKRLDDLETRNGGGDAYIIVDTRDLTPTEAEAAIEAAERQVGKHGKVIILEYVESWPPDWNA
jgi:hypothetical protein